LFVLFNLCLLQGKDGKIAKRRGPERFLSATFADLPAPEWHWKQMPSAPVPRLDGYSIQIKNMFYVFAGYANLDHVSVFRFLLFNDLMYESFKH